MKTINEIIEAIPKENQEAAKTFLTGLEADAGILKAIDSKEKAAEFISKNEFFTKAFDSKVSKSVDAYKLNNYDREVEEKVKSEVDAKMLEIQSKDQKTPEQLRIIELEKKVNESALKGIFNDRRNLTILELANRGLDISAATFLVGDSDEITRQNIDSLENFAKPYKTKIEELNNKLNIKDAQTGPPGGGTTDFTGIKNPFMFGADGKPGFDMDMQNKLFRENPALYNQHLAEHRRAKN